MINSKYLGRTYDNGWTVSDVEIRGRYGTNRRKRKNTYRFVLSRKTSDGKCTKSVIVNHNDICLIDRGFLKVEDYEKRSKTYINASSYQFYK